MLSLFTLPDSTPGVILNLSIILAAGFLATRATKKIHLPNVTGYILAGVLIGPYLLDLIPSSIIEETVVLLGRELEKSREHVYLDYEPSKEIDLPGGATYSEMKQWIQAEYGLKVSSLYISQVKRKCGLDVGQNYNLSKKEDAKVPQCPPEKEAAIEAALKHFKMI